MSVTVLLPVYNGARTLPQAIESILRQDLDDFELLVIDDASKDDSTAVIRHYAESDSRITPIVHERNAGLAATLNEGLERARHDLVARMDQDDESLRSRLRVQQEFMQSRPNIVVAGSWVRHMGATPEHDRVVELPQTPQQIARVLHRENCLYHPSVIMRRPEVLSAGGYRGEFKNAEDYELWLRLARTHDLANIPEPLLRYRFTVGGMTLGRKWEQLFYVHLAQEINCETGTTLVEATQRARMAMTAVDRRSFMRQVARGTTSELAGLHLWRDAFRLAGSFATDAGVVTAGGLMLYVLAAWARA